MSIDGRGDLDPDVDAIGPARLELVDGVADRVDTDDFMLPPCLQEADVRLAARVEQLAPRCRASRSVQAAAYAAASSSGVAMEVPCLDRLHDLRALAADETFGLDATPHVGQGNAHGLASLELSNSRSTST